MRPQAILTTLAFVLVTTPARAQEGFEFDVRVRAAVNNYGGERGGSHETPLQEFLSDAGGGFGFDVSTPVHPNVHAGLTYLTGRFPRVHMPFSAGTTIDPASSSQWIHLLGVTGRYVYPTTLPVRPYVYGGLVGSYAYLNGRWLAGFGPRLGAGVLRSLGPALDAFVEADAAFIRPGDALDLAGHSADMLSYVGFGLQYRFGGRRATEPVQIHGVFGPERILTGETAVYGADVELGGLQRALWDFGDGRVHEGLAAAHRFERPGTYTVTFSAGSGERAASRRLVTVVESPARPPEARTIRVVPDPPRAGRPATFVAEMRGENPTCLWDFGDGVTASDCRAQHVYEKAGDYAVRLIVEDPHGTAELVRDVSASPDRCALVTALNPVYFSFGMSTLTVHGREFLRENVQRLLECPDVEVTILGYASPDENDPDSLTEARAESVARYYVALGVPRNRVSIEGKGHIEDVPEGDALWQYRYAESIPTRQ